MTTVHPLHHRYTQIIRALTGATPDAIATALLNAHPDRADQLAALAREILYGGQITGGRIAAWRERLDTLTEDTTTRQEAS